MIAALKITSALLALHLVYPAQSSLPTAPAPVSVEFHEADDILYADFTVTTPTINAKPVLNQGEYPYMFDVVEIFVSVDGDQKNLPYYEFELSPNDQTFEVKIIDPKHSHIDGVDMGLVHSVEPVQVASGREWRGHMAIPLKRLGWRGDRSTVIGNAFAVLGQPHHRSYWSLSLPAEQKPNFHLPQFFKPLLP